MTITINTDASFHPRHKVGGYAFWIVCEKGRIIKFGPLKTVTTSLEAELQCIGNALYCLLQSGFTNIKYVVINTDCQYGIEAVTKGRHNGSHDKVVKKINEYIGALRDKYKIGPKKKRKTKFINWRYVPAHSEGGSPREWVNNRLDELAKQEMRKLLNNNKPESQ